MTPEQIALLKTSFAKVEPIAEQAAALFYKRLFDIAPSVKPLFKNDINKQGQMLMSTIGMVIKNIENPEKIVPVVRGLGQRHNAYGTKPEHYPIVGETLLWTLEQGLGTAFTPDHKTAWAGAYALLAGIMIEAQQDDRTQSSVA